MLPSCHHLLLWRWDPQIAVLDQGQLPPPCRPPRHLRENVCAQSRTQPDQEPSPPTAENSQTTDGEQPPTVISELEPKEEGTVLTITPRESLNKGCEPMTSVAEGILVELVNEDWLMDLDTEVLPPTRYYLFTLDHHCFKTALRLFR